MQREIPRSAECPPLTPELTRLLTQLIYPPNDSLTPSDLIFVFGSRDIAYLVPQIHLALQAGISRQIIFTGGKPQYTDLAPQELSESERLDQKFDWSIYPHVHHLLETTSTNTLANVEHSTDLLPSSPASVTFIHLWYLARRSRLCLNKVYPSAKLFQFCIPKYLPGNEVMQPETWHLSSEGRNRTYGEYLRLSLYGERGDFPIDTEGQILIQSVKDLLH